MLFFDWQACRKSKQFKLDSRSTIWRSISTLYKIFKRLISMFSLPSAMSSMLSSMFSMFSSMFSFLSSRTSLHLFPWLWCYDAHLRQTSQNTGTWRAFRRFCYFHWQPFKLHCNKKFLCISARLFLGKVKWAKSSGNRQGSDSASAGIMASVR